MRLLVCSKQSVLMRKDVQPLTSVWYVRSYRNNIQSNFQRAIVNHYWSIFFLKRYSPLDINNEAYLDARIDQLTDTHIKATIFGVTITGFDVVEIKAVTYHDLKIEQHDGEWIAEIVFDI